MLAMMATASELLSDLQSSVQTLLLWHSHPGRSSREQWPYVKKPPVTDGNLDQLSVATDESPNVVLIASRQSEHTS